VWAEHLEGLLHLATFAAAVSAAYVGLDKFGGERYRSAYDKIAPEVAHEETETKRILYELDIMKNDVAVLKTKYGAFWQYLLCYITGTNYEIEKWRSFLYFFRRQKHIPLLGFFRKRLDTPLVTAMLVWTLVSLFFLIGETLDISPAVRISILRYLFISYIAIICSVFFLTFAIQWRLQKIKLTCQGCYRIIRNEMREVTDLAERIKQRTAAGSAVDSLTHPDQEIDAAVTYAESRGWRAEPRNGHAWARLFCPGGRPGDCVVSVWSTPADPISHARAIRGRVNACTHRRTGR
jgi:hypothetical protein